MNELDLERLEEYLDGRLPIEEQFRLEERLAAETELQQDLQWLKDARKVAIGKEEVRLKELLKSKQQKQAKTARLSLWAYAATVLIIVVMLGIVWYFSRSSSMDLYAQYFEPYPNVSVPIERSQPLDNLKVRAFTSYEKEDFSLATAQLDSLLQLAPNNDYRFYLGNALLATKQYAAAAQQFEKITTNGSQTFQQHTQWYLGLAYLKSNKPKLARAIFQAISQIEGHIFQEQAKEMVNNKW